MVEIETESQHLVIEAKRSWVLPQPEQIDKYVRRLAAGDERERRIAVVAECSRDYPPALALVRSDGAMPVSYIPGRALPSWWQRR